MVTVELEEIQPPPQVLTGIGSEYIRGVVNQDGVYLIILDTERLFDVKELQQLERIRR